ncbi:MAG: amidohydrolase family protein, partial [Chloroflexota bacterium]|nr:amidohydrolase family protein [Chloroflexota bacterium]
MPADLIVHGGPILTMSADRPVVDAVGVANGLVVAAGNEAEVRERMPAGVDTVALNGRLATPGLYDAHAHTMMTGFSLLEVDVSAPGVATIDDIIRRIRERAHTTELDTWIVGQGYDQASLAEQRHPTRHDLDEAA